MRSPFGPARAWSRSRRTRLVFIDLSAASRFTNVIGYLFDHLPIPHAETYRSTQLRGMRPALLELARECALAVEALERAVDGAASAAEGRWSSPPPREEEGNGVLQEALEAEAAEPAAYEVGASAREHFEAVRDLTLMHAYEMWTLRLFGAGAP